MKWPWQRKPYNLAEGLARIHQAIIVQERIHGTREHRYDHPPGTWLVFHGVDPYHCVCNGTHVMRGWCPRCPEVTR